MIRKALFVVACVAAMPSVALAIHEKEGVINDTFPLTIGSPVWPDSVYSGISLRILPSAPIDLLFNPGQAAWGGISNATIVDTAFEQSIFLFDTNAVLPLVPNPNPMYADFGLVIGDLIPEEYYGPFPNVIGPSHLDPFIEVGYRLVGSTEILTGSIESFAFVPEPNTMIMAWLGACICLRLRSP